MTEPTDVPSGPSSAAVLAGLTEALAALATDAVLELHAADRLADGPLVRLWRAPGEIRAELADGLPASADAEQRARAFGWLPPGTGGSPRWWAALPVPASDTDRQAFGSRLIGAVRDVAEVPVRDLLYRHWLLGGGEGRELPGLGIERLAVTHYARLGETDPVRRPRGLLRRTEIGYRFIDEALDQAGSWRPTREIDDAELGRLGDRLVTLDESVARQLILAWPDGLPDPDEGEMRRSRIERDADGLPSAPGRPRLTAAERASVGRYLRGAPAVVSVLGYDPDPFDPDGAEVVPLHIRTDGTWIWSEAEGYYAERYGVPPDPELLDHIRTRDYQWPDDLDDEILDRASRLVR